MYIQTPCKSCRGLGKEFSSICSTCKGQCRIKKSQRVTLDIPAGIAHGNILSPETDLHITVLYKSHPEYELSDNMMDVASNVIIDIFTATLGGDIKVKTLGGEKIVKITPTCQTDTVMRIKGAGMKRPGRVGDHYIQIKIKLPEDLTVEQKSLLQKLDATLKGGDKNGEKTE
jgi:molecular chaperone DnaJ